jgi:hypothetical protein
MNNGLFLVGLVLAALGFVSFAALLIVKVLRGDGLECYFTGFGYQFNYIGALLLLCTIPVVLGIALFVGRYQRRDERDIEDRYLK